MQSRAATDASPIDLTVDQELSPRSATVPAEPSSLAAASCGRDLSTT